MPEQGSWDVVSYYLLEFPWPGAILLGVATAILVMLGLRDGRADRFKAAGATLLLGVLLVMTASLVTTAAEHGRAVTRRLVDAVVAGDAAAANALIAPQAVFRFGATTNAGLDADFIRSSIADTVDRFDIRSNMVTRLSSTAVNGDAVAVALNCVTTTDFGPASTQWMLRVERDDDELWWITEVVWLGLGGEPPRQGDLR